MRLFSAIDNWFTWLVFHKNDNQELIARKKFFLIVNLIAIFFLGGLTALSYLLTLKNFASYLLILAACNLGQSILLLIFRRWSGWFVYAVFSFYLMLIFYIIIRLGGLANSAGLLMAAYFFLLTAQWMEDTRLLFSIGALYIIGVIFTGISYPWLTAEESLVGWENNLFFAINFGWIGLLLALALYFTIIKSENAAKNRAKQLLELDLLKSKLYGNITHEFRTPLTLIRGNAEEIAKHSGDGSVSRANSIIKNSDKILFLVNQMLSLSRIEEGSVSLHYNQCDLILFIRSVVNSFQNFADSRKVGLHYQPQHQQLMMDIETDKLEEILSNLISNAVKYTPEEGDVYITVRKVLLSGNQLRNPEQQVEISVRDTGIGIPEDQLEKIFIRFYRIEDDRYPSQEGTGIGLTLVNEYLKLLKGTINVKSRSGEGSEFVFTLPVTHNAEIKEIALIKGNYSLQEENNVSPSSTIPGNINHPRLLIIEDNTELTEYLSFLLKSDYHILTAENGCKGIEMATEFIPDIILSDVMMPGRDGYQVCQQLKNDDRTNHIPIVLLTARADADSRISGLAHGADAYLTKPFDKKELTTCLHNLFVQREKLRLKFQSNLYDKHPEETIGALNDNFLNRTIKILEQNYCHETFGIDSLCQVLEVSRVQLHRKLTALTGLSASNFIRNFRLQKAYKLLLETDCNISEIAYRVGFSDPNYFTRSFMLEHGITPTELRKSVT